MGSCHNMQFLEGISSGGVGVFHVKGGGGAKKFGMSLETQENQTFWAGYPGILAGYPGGAQKV